MENSSLLGFVGFYSTSNTNPNINWSFKFPHAEAQLAKKHETYQSLSIQFKGILYNSTTLKQHLKIEDEISDATLIMIGFKQWGSALFSKLEGIFSFGLFDTQEAKLYLVKDRVSIHALYYYHDKKNFLFATVLKELAKQKNFHKNLNTAALSNYFTYGYILQPNTIYENCFKVKSGHFLIFDIATQQIQEEQYWDLGNCYDEPKLQLDEESFKEHAKELLITSIKKRMQSAGNYAASLSGGYDSSTVTAILQDLSPHSIKTFTIGFEDESINEAPDAKKIATHLGTEHIEHYFNAKDALDIVPKLSEVYDEPFYDNGSIPTTLLTSIAANENIETIFAGDGGDEVFATADDIERFDFILSTPQPIRDGIFKLLDSINPSKIPYIKEQKNFPTKYYKFINILKAKSIPEMVQVKMTLFHPHEIKSLIKSDDITYPSIFDTLYFGQYAQSVDKVIGSYFKTFMTDGELIKTTQAFRQKNISIREPYLDKDLIEFMAKVPSEIKIKDGIKKNLLKQIAYDYIPKELLDRPKKGFSVPFSQWMKGELKPLMMQTLSEENLKIDGILDPSYVINIRNNFLSGKEEYKYKLWSILLYQLWYEKNMR
jgi:asparagine synthase (glutamine-hydrolysing)